MSTENVTEAMQRLLHSGSSNEVQHCLAVGELLERLVRATGRKQKDIGKIAAALILLWRGDHDGVEQIEPARLRALEALRNAEFGVDELTRLATCGRLLLNVALELQGEQLLAEVSTEAAEYVPQEGD